MREHARAHQTHTHTATTTHARANKDNYSMPSESLVVEFGYKTHEKIFGAKTLKMT